MIDILKDYKDIAKGTNTNVIALALFQTLGIQPIEKQQSDIPWIMQEQPCTILPIPSSSSVTSANNSVKSASVTSMEQSRDSCRAMALAWPALHCIS